MKKYNHLELCNIYKMSILQFSYAHFYMYSAAYCHIFVIFNVLGKLILLGNVCVDFSLYNMEESITKLGQTGSVEFA